MIIKYQETRDAAKQSRKIGGGKTQACLYNICRFFSNVNFKVNAAFMFLQKGTRHKAALLPFKPKRIKRVRDVKSQFFVLLLNQLHSVLFDDTATLKDHSAVNGYHVGKAL